MKLSEYFQALMIVLVSVSSSFAQTRQGGGQGFNPAQMVQAEKKMVYDSISTLTSDQKQVIDMIYEDYQESFAKAREEANGDFQAMRPKMMALREEKDKSMKEILTEDQYQKYTALLEAMRQRRNRGN